MAVRLNKGDKVQFVYLEGSKDPRTREGIVVEEPRDMGYDYLVTMQTKDPKGNDSFRSFYTKYMTNVRVLE